jgi:hypothetical protein
MGIGHRHDHVTISPPGTSGGPGPTARRRTLRSIRTVPGMNSDPFSYPLSESGWDHAVGVVQSTERRGDTDKCVVERRAGGTAAEV